MGMVVLSKSYPFVRDYKVLLDIDTEVWNKIFWLAENGEFGKELTPSERAKIIEIFNTMKGEGKPIKDFHLSNDIEAIDILRIVLKLNLRAKMNLVLGHSARSTFFVDDTISSDIGWIDYKTSNQDYFITLDKNRYASIINQYACASAIGGSCKGDWSRLKNMIGGMSTDFRQDTKDWWKKIKDTSKKLSNRVKKLTLTDTKSLNQYDRQEHDIISSQSRTNSLYKRSGLNILDGLLNVNGTESFSRLAKKARADTKEFGTQALDTVKKSRQSLKRIFGGGSSEQNDWLIWTNNFTDDQKKIISAPTQKTEENIAIGLSDLITRHQNMLNNQINASPDQITIQIAKITKLIRNLNQTLNNDTRPNLIRICKVQCSNLGGDCS